MQWRHRRQYEVISTTCARWETSLLTKGKSVFIPDSHSYFIYFLNKKLIYLMLTIVKRYFWVCWHFNLDNFIPDFIGRKQSRLFCSCIKTFRISVPMIPGYMEDITNFKVNSIRVVRYYMLLYSNYFVRVLSTIVINVIQWFEPARCIASDWLH